MTVDALYRRAFARGLTDAIVLTSADGLRVATGVRARVTAHSSGDLVGAVEKSSFAVLVLADDLAFFGEVRDGDTVTMRGRTYIVAAADPHQRSTNGRTLAYTLSVKA